MFNQVVCDTADNWRGGSKDQQLGPWLVPNLADPEISTELSTFLTVPKSHAHKVHIHFYKPLGVILTTKA